MKWIWTVLAVVAALAPAVSQGSNRMAVTLQSEQRTEVVREAYRKLAERVAESGQRVSFEVSEARTIERAQLRYVSWLDLVTLPGGDMIDMTREERKRDGRTEAVVYRPEWSSGAEAYLDTPEGRRLFGMAADDVLAEIVRERPALERVTHVTTYRLTATLGERSRTYRAALLWLRPEGGEGLSVVFLDHVTQGLEEAARERPLVAAPQPLRRAFASSTTCNATNKSQTFSDHFEADDGHLSGAHSASASVQFSCTCASDCSASCQPNFLYSYCEEEGSVWDSCHKMASSIESNHAGSGDGINAPPGCAAGFGCIKKSCLYCACGLGVAVSVQGSTVSFTPSGEPDWSGNIGFSHVCAPCTEYVPTSGGGGGGIRPGPFYDDPGTGGGGGGGGGGGCCYWNTSCYVDANGVYTCTPSTCALWGC